MFLLEVGWFVTPSSSSVRLCATLWADALPGASEEGDVICVPQPCMSFPQIVKELVMETQLVCMQAFVLSIFND